MYVQHYLILLITLVVALALTSCGQSPNDRMPDNDGMKVSKQLYPAPKKNPQPSQHSTNKQSATPTGPSYQRYTPSSPKQPGRSAQEIRWELDKAYQNLADMQRQYEECTSKTMATQYPSMIARQQDLIRRLEEELRNATH